MLRIYADFNSTDEDGRVNLNTVGSLRDIEKHRAELRDGLSVVLTMTHELEVVGTLVFDGIWKGIPARRDGGSFDPPWLV
jgi:hypothetical protein